MTNFDKPINRAQTASEKWMITNQPQHHDVTALTVADMDFETPSFIFDHLVPTSHILGYDHVSNEYFNSIINWQAGHHHLKIKQDAIVALTGVLPGLSSAVRALTDRNDKVLVFTPVYNPFFSVINGARRQLVTFDLTFDDQNQYQIDFDQLELTLKTETIPLIILCNPQNPSGHLWTKDDLEKIVALARQYHAQIISDEIHQDLVFNPAEFTSLLEIKGADQLGLILTAATKTFNMPGVKNAFMIAPNQSIREPISNLIDAEFGNEISTFGFRATTAAYSQGNKWHDELIAYLNHNRQVIYEKFQNTSIQPMWPQATYLMWLNFTPTGLNDQAINERLVDHAHVQLNDGARYGTAGTHWFRLNFATQTSRAVAAVDKIIETFK